MWHSRNPELIEICDRLKQGWKPVILMGAGCSIGTGLPSGINFMNEASEHFGVGSEDKTRAFLEGASAIKTEVARQFAIPLKTSAAYEKFAFLINKGFFKLILTTNWDFLIEKSLSNFLSPDKYRVYVRGEASDLKIAKALTTSDTSDVVKVIKLHGDYLTTPIYNPHNLMNLDEKLTRTIASLINKHGIIIIGYRILKEPRFIGLINNATNIFVIDPVPYKPDELAGLGRKNAIQIAENDGKFENFVESLSNRLAVSEYRNWIKVSTNGGNAPLKVVNQLGVEEVTNKIRTRFEIANINKDGVKNLTNEMLHTIENAFTLERIPGGGGICLIFIKDPTAPGGTEIERLILDDHSLNSIITGWDIEAIEMTKRSEDRGKRSVSQWKRNGHTKNLRDYGAVVLIDSVSFTGNTIDVAYNYLCKHSDREPNRYSVAVLVTPQEIVHKLTKLGLTVYSIKPNYSGSDITFPWGWTTATKPVYGKDNLQDPFIPRDRFSFIPKPWGNELTFSDNARVTVNLLTLERGQRTSLHYHLLREETFIVLDNLLQVSLWDQYLKLEQHQSIRIPSGVPHSLIALSQPCRVLEISEGHLDKEDIVRIIDSYERS